MSFIVKSNCDPVFFQLLPSRFLSDGAATASCFWQKIPNVYNSLTKKVFPYITIISAFKQFQLRLYKIPICSN